MVPLSSALKTVSEPTRLRSPAHHGFEVQAGGVVRLVAKTGFVRRCAVELLLARVQGISVHQGI
jgi:hypothetical protein